MSEVANIYDNGPISPICRVGENIAAWTEQKWIAYKVEYIEPVPLSRPFLIDALVLGAVTAVAANGTVGNLIVPALQMQKKELAHLRWTPIDDVEGLLFQLAQMARFSLRGGQARVSLFTKLFDPWLATTTFWILGDNKDINLQTINPNPVPIYTARFAFVGFRYILSDPLTNIPVNCTYLPAQGR